MLINTINKEHEAHSKHGAQRLLFNPQDFDMNF